MVVCGGFADIIGHVLRDLRAHGAEQCDESVLFLAGENEIGRAIQPRAINAVAGAMAVGHERQYAEAGHARLASIQSGKGSVGFLLSGKPGKRAVDRRIQPSPYFGRENGGVWIVGSVSCGRWAGCGFWKLQFLSAGRSV